MDFVSSCHGDVKLGWKRGEDYARGIVTGATFSCVAAGIVVQCFLLFPLLSVHLLLHLPAELEKG